MNVAYHLHQLGLSPALITRIGPDARGQKLLKLLIAKNIDTALVQRDEDVPTGIVHATANAAGDMTYEIVAPAAWDHITVEEGLPALVTSLDYFIFGSLAARSKTSRQTLFELLESAKYKVLDINLRAPFYDQRLIQELMTQADLVKMNDDELKLISAFYGNTTGQREQMAFLRDKFSIEKLIVTRGAAGAIVLLDDQYTEHPGYKVTVADTIGSGDSFLAAFIYCTINGKTPEETLAFAGGLGALVASRQGAWPEYEKQDILRMIDPAKVPQQ